MLSLPFLLALWSSLSDGLRYDAGQADWNLNQNKTATNPLDYWGEWKDHDYNPSPKNWRMPFYVAQLDRFANGDPTNDEANGTVFEHDWMTNQFRFGGDLKGFISGLDYIHGMGIKVIYLMGSPFINQPWIPDGFSPLDTTLLDHHHGTIQDWRNMVDEIHARGMYLVLDNTLATLGDLLAFKGSENATAAFRWQEYEYAWKYTDGRKYWDFEPGNDVMEDCRLPRFWDDDGFPLNVSKVYPTGPPYQCRDSEFSSYGDLPSTGHFPVYETQLGKFGSVQDRLREWRGDVLEKLKHFSCLQIAMLDFDGYRWDKALQASVDALAEFAEYQRECARRYGKDNFFVTGEVVGTDKQAAVYYGRGKQPDQYTADVESGMAATNTTSADQYIRPVGRSPLDGTCFHYFIYGALTRFLGLEGDIGEQGVDFVVFWNDMVTQNDLVNWYTAEFDPRHMLGTTSQDVFRWPAIKDGTKRQLLGQFITALVIPGTPALFWGEEQSFYILDSIAEDYLYGRQPMSSSRAWQIHGCYHLNTVSYIEFPLEEGLARYGCHDDNVSLDHKDVTHPARTTYKRFLELREQYPTLQDGFHLEMLSNQTVDLFHPGANGIPTPTGIYSVYRSALAGRQNLAGTGQGNQGVWLLYSNEPSSKEYKFDCGNRTDALLSPYPAGTRVKNLMYPYDEYSLEGSTVPANGTADAQTMLGCLPTMPMDGWGYKAFVPKANFAAPRPSMTGVVPLHDQRLTATVEMDESETVPIEMHFSAAMDCQSVTDNLAVESTTQIGVTAELDRSSIQCAPVTAGRTQFSGQPATSWVFKAQLAKVGHGIHTLTVRNASNEDGTARTEAVDRFMFRIGAADNPMVFPLTSNYSTNLLHRDGDDDGGKLYITPRAAGAEKMRYSRNWGSSWSEWMAYTGERVVLQSQAWAGTAQQAWEGEHVIVQYWGAMAGSSDHVQHADLDLVNSLERRWPHAFVLGLHNTWGFDSGLASEMSLVGNGTWAFNLSSEWPTSTTVNVWGMNPDGRPDKSMQYGDVDGDHVLDWLHPDSLAHNFINISDGPAMPHTAWQLHVHDGNYTFYVVPVGNAHHQLLLSILLALLPVLTGSLVVWLFMRSYYHVMFNQIGVGVGPASSMAAGWRRARGKLSKLSKLGRLAGFDSDEKDGSFVMASHPRRTTLIGTMEYEIPDWNIKIKIGGLGAMASLMGKALTHQDIIWVVPCVGGIEYPLDTPGEPMAVTVNGVEYLIDVQYHVLKNVTYVLLDAPIFRRQTRAEPYPPRMDDLDSAIYYSAWNACIAEAIKRFPVDFYLMNDYHGALAPLYLLPDTIPTSLCLHNAEFQGLWPLRSQKEMAEISKVFNLSKDVIRTYVQFGEVFNLLHAGASYLRLHQKGFGAVGVSKKYGARALKRYPIFWGLSNIGALPNPDPSDLDQWDGDVPDPESVMIDQVAEAGRSELRRQCQEWAGLEVMADAELCVFVGRWSEQKGVDIIADVFPALLDKHAKLQLICVGPVIDLYGKFAALKLDKMMSRYPGRVCSRPIFTALPDFVFSGAEFALIPSRDEPFGLVAVEFGRKGALGIGSKVGGLGQMPGWWFSVESMATKHLIRQFKLAIEAALASSQQTRALMRARSSVQRFPVAQWLKELELLQNTSIQLHRSVSEHPHRASAIFRPRSPRLGGSMIQGADSNVDLSTTTRPGTAVGSPLQMGSPIATGANTPRAWPLTLPDEADESGQATPMLGQGYGGGSWGSRSRSLISLSNQLGPRLHALAAGGDDNHPASYQLNTVITVPNTPGGRDSPESPATLSVDGASLLANHNPYFALGAQHHHESVLSVDMVVGDRRDFKLQNVDPFFNDPNGHYYQAFQQKLDRHDGSLSSEKLCVEDYLKKSEKQWFGRFADAKQGRSRSKSRSRSRLRLGLNMTSVGGSEAGETAEEADDADAAPGIPAAAGRRRRADSSLDEFQMSHDYIPPTGPRNWLMRKVGDWPLYAFLLAFGQIIAANSYQVTLLTGDNNLSAEKLYAISSIFAIGSMFWWCLSRYLHAVHVLSLPFFFYGLAFLVLGMTPYTKTEPAYNWLQNVATGLYAFGSSSGFLFFSMNFASEGGTPIGAWVFRACAIQGTQQIYVAVLWYWGSYISAVRDGGGSAATLNRTTTMTAVTVPLTALLWAVGLLLLLGLPDAYRTRPGAVPAFYVSLLRRNVVVWFFVVVAIQNYWLSPQYGRSWTYLWSSKVAPAWCIVVLMVLFFVVVWALLLYLFARISREHSWALPLFAIGLGAPRWGQELWACSGVGLWLPWAWGGSKLASALLGRALWLWLGVLDTVQGLGFGMMLLQTLTRLHMTAALAAAQVLGAGLTILARATAPHRLGPGPVFPNLSVGAADGVTHFWFWVPLVFQLAVCVGFFVFFRKEQLFKP